MDLNDIKKNEHLQNQLQFISGLGPKKAHNFLERLRDFEIEVLNRHRIE